MPWSYKTHAELKAAGYKFQCWRRCTGSRCRRMIYLYKTPKGKTMPIDPATFEPHHATCVDVDTFRKRRSR